MTESASPMPSESPPVTTFDFPHARWTVPQPEDMLAVSHKDWKHLEKSVADIRFPLRWTENVMWIAIPLIPGAAVSLATWLPAYSALPNAGKLEFSWVAPAIIAVGVSALVIAIYSGLVARTQRGDATRDTKHIRDDMAAIYAASRPPESKADSDLKAV